MLKPRTVIILLSCVIVLEVICYTAIIGTYRRDLEKMEKENTRYKVEIYQYKWENEQYSYMFDKYCTEVK